MQPFKVARIAVLLVACFTVSVGGSAAQTTPAETAPVSSSAQTAPAAGNAAPKPSADTSGTNIKIERANASRFIDNSL